MRLFRRCVLAWVAAVLTVWAGAAAAQTNFTTVVVFGDSLSDTGNIAHLTQSQYGLTYPSYNALLGFDYTTGSFTDGTDTKPAASTAYSGVWVKQLATLFGANVTVKDSLDGGTNYAYGDASTAGGTTTESKTYLGQTFSITLNNMGQQVQTYLATNPTPNAQTLYVLWGGANDLLNAASAGQDPVAAAQTAVGNELALVQQLAAAGATNFLIPNLPPLGAFAASEGPAAVTALNTASGAFAVGLTAGLNALKQSSVSTPLNIFQPDVFTLFQDVAATPMAYGFGNLTTVAQTVTVSPDTYLIWDGLHPTTTGHHLVAATAANLLSPLSTSSVVLAAPAAGLAGQPLTVTATVTSGKSGNVPTGLVTVFDGTTVAGSGALDATGAVQVTFTPTEAAGANVSLTAVYAGDVINNRSSSSAQTTALLGAAVGTTTALTSSNANANVGASVTFKATVTPAVTTYGAPTGTVTFLDGSATLGTGPLTNGVATYTTTSLTAGTHQITAMYTAAGLFGGSTSAAVPEVITAPGFIATASPTSLTIASGGSGSVSLSATSAGGYTGSLTVTCGQLPAHFACGFSSPTLAVGGTASTDTLTISTNAAATTVARSGMPTAGGSQVWMATLLLPGTTGLMFFGLRRRRLGLRMTLLGVGALLMLSAGLTGMTGCSSDGSTNNAPAGTYTVPVIFTPAAASSGTTPAATTVNISVTVH